MANKASLADLAWLAGHWRGDWGPRTAEQVWMSPKAGVMTGTFRVVEDDRTLVIELFTLLQKPEGVEFRFRHFTPELTPWEKSDVGVGALNLEKFDGREFVFVNPADGQPRRALMIRVDQDTYVSRSEILPQSGGTQVIQITYRRDRPAAAGAATSRPKTQPH